MHAGNNLELLNQARLNILIQKVTFNSIYWYIFSVQFLDQLYYICEI